jgi:hypothetical protein
LPAFASGGGGFFRGEFMGSPFFVGGAPPFAGNFALLGRIHGGESALAGPAFFPFRASHCSLPVFGFPLNNSLFQNCALFIVSFQPHYADLLRTVQLAERGNVQLTEG